MKSADVHLDKIIKHNEKHGNGDITIQKKHQQKLLRRRMELKFSDN